MRSRYKKRCLRVLPPGLLLMGLSVYFIWADTDYKFMFLVLGVPGFILYVRGLLLLARAKGLSEAIVLTILLGVITPLAILLLLEDKNRKF